jgi:hypothetical protein
MKFLPHPSLVTISVSINWSLFIASQIGAQVQDTVASGFLRLKGFGAASIGVAPVSLIPPEQRFAFPAAATTLGNYPDTSTGLSGNATVTPDSAPTNTTNIWGATGDIPAPGDFDGDGVTDLSVFRPSTGQWFIFKNDRRIDVVSWGQAGDIPSAADYDGDGSTDMAVFRPSNGTWYIIESTRGIRLIQFGQDGDVPMPAAYLP